MKIALTLALLLCTATTSFADKSILDNKKTVKVDCVKDPNVMVNGNGNNVKTKGTCAAVTVTGNGNHVTVEAATTVSVGGNENALTIDAVDTLSVTGNKNAVTYKRAVTKDAQPVVSTTGKDDKVVQAK
jgi:hypothetical protein